MSELDSVIPILEQIHDGKTHIGEYLSSVLENMPVMILWKDKDSIFQGANKFLFKTTGLSYQNVQKITDFDILPEDQAMRFVADDRYVITTGKPRFDDIREATFSKKSTIIENVTKFPIFDNLKKTIGVVGVCTISSMTNQQTILKINRFMNGIDNQKMFLLNGETNYYIKIDEQLICLTIRQAEILTYLSMGKTAKEIAQLLDCSIYTVKDHIENLKYKLKIHSTSALIEAFWHNPIKWF